MFDAIRRGRNVRVSQKVGRVDEWDRRMCCVIEALEARQLLSASVVGGVLTVDGTAESDTIIVVAGPNDGEVIVKKAPGVDRNMLFTGVDSIQINGLDGNDRITAKGAFTDTLGAAIGVTIDAGAGNDKIKTDDSDDTIMCGSGNDSVKDKGGDNDIDGEDGDDKIKSGSGDDDIDGGSGNDSINDKGGNNTIAGGTGEDKIKCGLDDDSIDAGDDDDKVSDRGGNNDVSLGSGNDSYRGGRDAEHVRGDDGNDHIRGGKGDDYLEGGNGDDKLKGQAGSDYMSGDDGDDDYDRHKDDDIDWSPSDGESDADSDGDDDDEHGDVSTETVAFAGDNTAQIMGTSDSHDDRNFYRFTAPISGTLDVQITADSGPLAEAELEDVFSVNLLELEDGDDSGSAAVTAGKTYLLRMRAPGDVASTYTVDLTIT